MNDNVFNCVAASSSENSFDKNEYYVENGLAKRQKKDSKSRGKIASDQMETRNKIIADHISQLPKKMQAKLAENAVVTDMKPGKCKNKHVTKIFHTRKNTDSGSHLGDYIEQQLAEDDARNEAYEVACEEDLIEKSNEYDNEYDNEEERYQAYLEKKHLWDFPDYGMSQWDLMCLKDEVNAYEAELEANRKEGEQIWKVIYEDHKYQLDHCRTEWSPEELKTFQIKVDEYETHHGINLKSSEKMWLKYDLTKEQFDAYQEYKENCADLEAYYSEPEYANYPEYGIRLEAAIKKFKDEFDAQKVAALVAEDENDWWIDAKDAKDAKDDDDQIAYEEWCELRREQEQEDFRQEMMDDRHD